MKIKFLDLKAQYQSIKREIDKAIQNVIEDTAFVKGKYVEEFETNFAKAIGIKHCVGVGNGTDAITIALKSLGIEKNDEVITAANSFVATSEAITNAGAKVSFVDCQPDTYTIDTSKIEEKITTDTKAIIPVHLYGQPAEMDEILTIAKKHNLFVIEDCAQAHLAEYKGKRVGSFGNISTFSFYPGKNLGAYGDAGAIVTNNDKLEEKARMFANHGRIAKYDHEFEGYNSRMDGIQGAVLNVKLKYLEQWTNARRKVVSQYNELLKENKNIITPFEAEYKKAVYHLYVIRTTKRDELQSFLKENDIASGIHYPIALPNLTAYKYLNYSQNDFPIATKYQNEILSLPVYPEMTNEMIEYIVKTINKFYS
ncbi:MAG: DegT/DnrJ/EryC1/StrS family aminotransferase [Bacteroidota bacterium]|nr:DegT/DnrJ/EryC1/StrS family aminotransferase [Bacteroidota bacterium]